jgi:hypothetical protein
VITVKYAIKVGGRLFPKGTQLRLATAEDLRKVWPGMAPNPQSRQVGVWFPGFDDHPTIVDKSQIEGLADES